MHLDANDKLTKNERKRNNSEALDDDAPFETT